MVVKVSKKSGVSFVRNHLSLNSSGVEESVLPSTEPQSRVLAWYSMVAILWIIQFVFAFR